MLRQVHVSAFTVVPSRSGVVRPFSERSVLEVFMARMAALSLSGYIFFGSSVSISEKVLFSFFFFSGLEPGMLTLDDIRRFISELQHCELSSELCMLCHR